MRKNNKKRSSSLLTKTGVILVTIFFIVAVSLIFITTALMISIAGRQRVYTNAIDSQARLTCLSLSQAIWQAIYSQQITDADLVSLAKGTAGNGSVVVFTNSDLPGMGLGDSECTAYFYCIGNPSKIGIECKCEINGTAQYYRMVLERHRGEEVPPAMFEMVVELGDGGMLNSCNFGLDASKITGNSRDQQVSFDAPDNMIFLHNPTMSDQDGSGIYSTLLTDGMLYLRDGVFARDMYFIGPNAGVNFVGTNQNNSAQRTRTGATVTSTTPASQRQYANLYFWGVNSPFYRNGTAINGSDVFQIRGINNIYFDMRNTGDASTPHYEGFSTFRQTFTTQNFQTSTVTGDIHYENGITGWGVSGGSLGASYPDLVEESTGWDPVVANGIDQYLTVNPDVTDTVGEVQTILDAQIGSATDYATINSISGMSGGNVYRLTGTSTLSGTLNVNLNDGDVYLIIAENQTLHIGQNAYIMATGSADHKFYILLESGAKIMVGSDNGEPRDNSGIIDTSVFSGTPYTDVTKLNQTKVPRIYIFSTYLGGTQITYRGNNNCVITAHLGLFPATTRGAGGGHIAINNCNVSHVYYGRIACGGIDTLSGGNFNIPYCPSIPSSNPDRPYAYRDVTDFSVNQDECEFFTA